LMMFWSWAKGLEEAFDGENRRNPRHFIFLRHSIGEKGSEKDPEKDLTKGPKGGAVTDISNTTSCASQDNDDSNGLDNHHQVQLPSLLRQRNPASKTDGIEIVDESVTAKSQDLVFFDEASQKATLLPRIPTCAIFHKLTSGPGVPHAFYGYIRQMPALPRVVIFLSVHMFPIAYVSPEDAYVVTKVRSIQGFYGATYRLGFRDDFKPSTEQILRIIEDIEARDNPSEARRIIAEIKEATERTVHLIPHYHVLSTDLHFSPKWAAVALSWTRRLLIESIYRRLVTMFPETANWIIDHNEILHVGLNAPI